MPLRYMGASPAEDANLATFDYVNSLGTQNLSEADVRLNIRERFESVVYATSDWANSVINSTLTGQAFARQSDLTSAFANKIAVLGNLKSRANGPIALDVSGKVDTSLITKASTQTLPRRPWSPSSYPVLSNVTAETNILSIPITSPYANYRVFVTGTINAKVSADGQYPIVRVRAGGANATAGQVVATGYGLGESHGGGSFTSFTSPGPYTYLIPGWANKIDVVVLGGGGGGLSSVFGEAAGGGKSGEWNGRTLTKGTDFSASLTSFTGSVGDGSGPKFNFEVGNDYGQVTDCKIPGAGTLQAAGGRTGGNVFPITVPGTNSGSGAPDYPFNGRTYKGSLNQNVAGANGNLPGGGGAGGEGLGATKNGGRGAPGAAFFYAYITDDTNYGQVSVVPEPTFPVLTGNTTLYVNLLRSGGSVSVSSSSVNPQISVMVVPA